MPSHLHLRYAGKIKQFKWPMDPTSAIQAIAKAFAIKPESITGFKDKDGKYHTLVELVNDPEEAQKQSFMLVVQNDEKKSASPSPNKDIRPQSTKVEKIVEPSTPSIMQILNYPEFERIFLENQNHQAVIFVLNNKQQLDDVFAKANNILAQFGRKFEFFYYVHKGAFDDLSIMTNAYPLVLVYDGPKRLVEIPLHSNQKNLINLLTLVQNQDAQGQNDEFESYPVSFAKNDTQITALKQLEELFDQNDITGLEYYYLKSSLLEGQNEAVSLFSRYSKSRDSDQLRSEIKELTSRELRPSTQPTVTSVKSPAQANLNQNVASRPLTSENAARSRTKEISSMQERLIQMTAEIERKGLLNEHSASLIKSLILEENADVFRVMSSYESDYYDEQELSFKLTRLAEKLSPSIIRPTSPLPKKDELIRLVNNLVRKRLRDDNLLLLLNKLIMEGDELLYSTFEVFESDRDEEDLLDTLIRIVQRYRKKGKYPAHPFYGDAEQAEIIAKDRKGGVQERPPSQGSSSYFLENKAKSRKGTREHNIEKDVFGRKEALSPVNNQEADLNEVIKSLPSVRSLPADECGMVLWIVKTKLHLVKDVVNDHGGVNNIERAIQNIVLLANKELNTNLKERFDETQRNFINDKKREKNSATYAAFQCFKYDQDLEGLLSSLQEIVRHMPRTDKKYGDLSQSSQLSKKYTINVSQNAEDQSRDRERQAQDSVTSIKVETPSQPVRTGSSSNNLLDTGRPSGSKYTQLLTRDQRTDSFKGMFQLKLVSSDNPAAAAASRDQTTKAEPVQTKVEVLETGETKNSLDAHLHVIIPPKNDINPFTQTFIDRFYESQGGFMENFEKFKNTLAKFRWITKDDIAKLEYLYENFYYELFEVIYTFEINRNLQELERRLKDDILTVDLDNISLASASPRERKRMTTYHSFKALLQNLRNESFISEKQYKTYLYLYTEEDVTILAAYEVYQFTKDIQDFIDTLLTIEKVQFFKNESKYFEDISNFNDYMEYQLKVIFSLKRYLTPETRATLEKIIRSGDTTVMQIYQDYKRSRDCKNKNNLIHKLVNFAEENIEIIKNYEKSIHQNKIISENKNVKRRDMIESFEYNKMIPEVKHFDLLYDAIESDDELIHSIFEIYDFTKDRFDFIENVALIYKFIYKRNVIDILKKNRNKLNLTEPKIELIEDLAKKNDPALTGIIEIYYANQDLKDLFENVSLLIQTKMKVKGNILNFVKKNKNKLGLTDKKVELIEGLAKKNDSALMGIIEAYYFNYDEHDFFENISLLVKTRTQIKENALDLIRKNKYSWNLTETKIDIIENLAHKNDPVLMGIIELYNVLRDEKEFSENISLLLQAKTKVRGISEFKVKAY